jgi:hydrogenase maturation protease
MNRFSKENGRSPSPLKGSNRLPTLVIGLGNPILGDDGVGWRVAEAVERVLTSNGVPTTRDLPERAGAVDVECLSLGGLSLMEHLVGYENVIIVDAIHTGSCPQGTVRCLPLAELADPMRGHTTSAHDTSLQLAIEVGRTMGAELPDEVTIISIESPDVYDFSEELSPQAAAAVPVALKAVLDLLPIKQSQF